MQRDISLDLARGFTVLCIPAIHSLMVYSQLPVYESWLGIPLAFIAEGPGAQLLMLLMGMGVAFKIYTTSSILKKSVLLLLAGFVLNYLKFGMLLHAGLLPDTVIRELQIENLHTALSRILTIGDILHFAAIALVFVHFLRIIKYYWWWAVVAAMFIVFISPYCWDIKGNYLLELAGGQPPRVFFPLFPWLVYPLIGLTVGHYWKMNPPHTANLCGWAGIAMIFTGIMWRCVSGSKHATTFYRTYPCETVWHIGVVLLTLHAWKQIEKLSNGTGKFLRLLSFCSRHISVIYFIQWVLVCWLLPFIPYQSLNIHESLLLCVYTTAFTLGIARFICKN